MKNKKALPSAHAHNATQFVVSASLESVIIDLESFPCLKLQLLRGYPNQREYSARFIDDANRTSIFITMRDWNNTDTMVTLNYYRPFRFPVLPALLLLLLIILFAIVLALIDTNLLYLGMMIIIGCIMMALAEVNRLNGLGRISNSANFMPERK